MYNFMWADDKRDLKMKKATDLVNDFFDNLRDNQVQMGDSKVKLVYRVSQRQLARDIMRAIRDNEILIVEAGVGIGKTLAYLVPVFQTINQVEDFNSIVISTSNIALQQQLLTTINLVSKMLGIEVEAVIAKGINNYVCLSRMEELITISARQDKELLLHLRKEIEEKRTVDRDELTEIEDDIWKQIQLKNRGACSRCNYSKYCLYRNVSKNVMKADIVVTNHGNFVRSIMDDRDYINGADMFIFDEAHKLEEAIRSIDQGILNLSMIRNQINYYIENDLLKDELSLQNASSLILEVDNLFSVIRRRTSIYFSKNNKMDKNIKITDCDRLPINCNGILNHIHSIVKKLEKFIRDIKKLDYYKDKYKIDNLEEYLKVFKDMGKGKNSENIYWANYFQNNKIHIGYVYKNNSNITKNIFKRNIPVVCTSATLLDANGGYQYFKRGLSLDKMYSFDQTIVDGRVYPSPYSYDKNSLFYYDTTISSPNNYNEYVQELVLKISELIQITNGRALVLFTAKSTMKSVYEALQKENFDFKLLLQGTMSDSQICQKFENDVKSCLFATGAFWEGIDIAGKSLCNVIITKLPFDTVNAVTESKATQFSDEEAFQMVYVNDMVQKMAQGTGRLIRSEKDRGIVCCLDSRVGKYIDIIKNCTPYCNFTDKIEDVYEFSDRYITNRDKKRKIKEI